MCTTVVTSARHAGYEALFREATQRLESLGGRRVDKFDFKPFAQTASMLYQSAFIAERYAGAPHVCSSCLGSHAASACFLRAADGSTGLGGCPDGQASSLAASAEQHSKPQHWNLCS